jgi:MSHA biogenesis protein MshP
MSQPISKQLYNGQLLKQQQGFTLVAALFLMVVVALLLVFLLRTGSENQWSSSLRIQEARAFQSANSGLEWAVHQLGSGACPASPTTLNLSEADLNGFQVIVTCSSAIYMENTDTVTMFEIEALAQRGIFGTSPDFVARKLQLTVEGP